jgi:hypothetical protein
MDNKGALIFVLLLPILCALGHDAYYYYEHQDEGFMLSDIGWLWTTYAKESHDTLFAEIGQDSWAKYFVPFLKLYSVLAAAIFSGIILLIFITVSALKSLTEGRFSVKKKAGSLGRERAQNKKMVYKRK